MVNPKSMIQGTKVEHEHRPTYEWLTRYVKSHGGKLPPAIELYSHIAYDHLTENPDYYPILKEAGL